jgi:ribose transport system ATP-binding protein
MSVLLEIRGVSKSFFDNQVLKDICITLKHSEIHAVVGENGAGKSTLMKILAGVEKADSGEFILESNRVEIKTPSQAQSLGISTIFQDIQLIPSLSVVENIFVGRWPLHSLPLIPVINWKKAIAEAQRIFKYLNFEIDLFMKTGDLSFGQQKMVEIAKALCWKAKLLILDEVSAALNEIETDNLFNVLRRSKAMGVGIFFISHQINEVLKIADTVTVLHNGQLIETNAVTKINSQQIIQEMTGEDFVNRYPKMKRKIGPEVLRVSQLRDYRVLEDISFSIREGEIAGLTGLVGSGRTAVAKAIFGVNPLMAGKIYINNQEVMIKSPIDAIRHKIGFISEDRSEGLIFNMDMPSNITLAHLKGVIHHWILDLPLEKRITQDYVKRMGIKTTDITQKVGYLSGGNKQKVFIAKWLLSRAKIFIFDEPTKGLDVSSKVEVYNLINELILGGAAILLISSDLDELLGMSDRVLVMCRGKIVKELAGKDIREENIMYYYATEPL